MSLFPRPKSKTKLDFVPHYCVQMCPQGFVSIGNPSHPMDKFEETWTGFPGALEALGGIFPLFPIPWLDLASVFDHHSYDLKPNPSNFPLLSWGGWGLSWWKIVFCINVRLPISLPHPLPNPQRPPRSSSSNLPGRVFFADRLVALGGRTTALPA
jgi:hypothetical protein